MAAQAETKVVPEDALDPEVRQETIQQTILIPGSATSVKPSTSYTNGARPSCSESRPYAPAISRRPPLGKPAIKNHLVDRSLAV